MTTNSQRSGLGLLSTKHIPRCYFDKRACVTSMELHGFCDASEQAQAAVLDLRKVCAHGSVQTTLVTSKTKVALKCAIPSSRESHINYPQLRHSALKSRVMCMEEEGIPSKHGAQALHEYTTDYSNQSVYFKSEAWHNRPSRTAHYKCSTDKSWSRSAAIFHHRTR